MGYSGTNGLEQLKQLRNRKVARANSLAARRKEPVKDMMSLKAKIQRKKVKHADQEVLAQIREENKSRRKQLLIRQAVVTLVLALVIYGLVVLIL